MRKAVVDVGSNSVLLLVEEEEEGRWNTVLDRSWVTSLGAGTKETGLLSDQGVSRTLEALREAFDLARSAGADSMVAAATMAARIASNTPAFQERAAAQGTPLIVLSGDDEARLGFESVAFDPTFEEFDRLSIIDVGGQSTELATADRPEHRRQWSVLFRRSYGIGTLALRGGVLQDECPAPEQILKAAVEIDDTIGLCYRRGQCGHAIVLGATGTNLVTIRERMTEWQPERVHGAWLDFGEISQEAGRLFRLTEEQRSRLVGIEKGREPTLPSGALILERFLDAIGAPGCSVSVRGWRHALLEQGISGAS
jgi:exopolyphosphatase/guanosine-5'-triphosphate,3'-diphosphate pyrophosphatase